MSYFFSNVTPTSGQVVSTIEAKKHLEIAVTDKAHDLAIDSLILAATAYFEAETRRQLLTSVDDLYLDKFPDKACHIWIPRSPLSSVASVKYQDEDDSQQTLASTKYTVSLHEPPRIGLVYDEDDWPETAGGPEDVVIRLTTGYGAASAVPDLIKACIKMLVSSWFENREAVLVGTSSKMIEHGAQRIIDMYKVGDSYHHFGAEY